MAVTPDQDVLSFIASKDGKWRLSRVRGWQGMEPHEDRTVVPGLVYGNRADWFSPWSPELHVAPNGTFVVCIASALRSQGRGEDGFVAVVDLADFKVVASIHTPDVPALGGFGRTYRLDGQGHLVIRASTLLPNHPGDDVSMGGSRVKMAALSLPSLAVTDRCEYLEWLRGSSPPRREGENSCAELLSHEGGSHSLSDFIGSLVYSEEVNRTDMSRRPPQCGFLGYARIASRDGRYEREICLRSDRGFWGNPVVTKSVENIFSASTGAQIGSVNEPVTSVQSRFGVVDGRDYLIVMEGGTHLMVYAIKD
jgi:hypothetical protein